MPDLKRHQEELEEAKKAVRCPRAKEARELLFLTVPQFCQLLDISEGLYWQMVGGEKELTVNQRAFLVEAIRIARERGLITDERD